MHFVDEFNVEPLVRDTDHMWVSILMPTHRSGPQTTAGPLMLKNLLRDARELLDERDQGWLDEALNPLLEDTRFWQNQADGLALFVSPHACHISHVSLELDPVVRVSGTPHLTPLVPLFDRQREFTILQLSLKQVRLFDVVGEQIEEAELGVIPASVEALHADRDRQAQLQFTSQGTGTISYHGQGSDSDSATIKRQRFMRHVARGLEERLATTKSPRPVFLACPDHTAEMFSRISDHPTLCDLTIPGAADGLNPHALLQRARPVLDVYRDRQEQQHGDLLRTRSNQGRICTDLAETVTAAEHGRVETLFVGSAAATHINVTAIDRAAISTLRNSGTVVPAPGDIDELVIATLRY